MNAQRAKGVRTDTIVISGGAGQSPLVRQVLADATGLSVAATVCPEPVLLGSAILGAVAAGRFDSFEAAMAVMSEIEVVYEASAATQAWHDDRFRAFEALQAAYRGIRG